MGRIIKTAKFHICMRVKKFFEFMSINYTVQLFMKCIQECEKSSILFFSPVSLVRSHLRCVSCDVPAQAQDPAGTGTGGPSATYHERRNAYDIHPALSIARATEEGGATRGTGETAMQVVEELGEAAYTQVMLCVPWDWEWGKRAPEKEKQRVREREGGGGEGGHTLSSGTKRKGGG